MSRYYEESVEQIWDAETGERVEVCDDADGLGLIEVRHRTVEGEIGRRIPMTPEQAELVGQAIIRRARKKMMEDRMPIPV